MTDEGFRPATRLMNFVSQEQLDEAKKTRGPRVEDGTAQRDRPLFEILKENKDKKDAEFNERFKHRPPKALDEDETEFLDRLELSRREYEQQMANEEAKQLQSFQASLLFDNGISSTINKQFKTFLILSPMLCLDEYKFSEEVAAKSTILQELKETPVVLPKLQERQSQQSSGEKKTRARPLGVVIKVKPQAKKAKIITSEEACKPLPSINNVVTGGLVSYSDESDDDDD
ncbi:hypothetical protein SSX86_004860 [Deinandra increscens subsp. villosa]|uniref:FAM192A/Fyv6 N-terminal domain-containing protein n=1 Tax=Deinandra increscens subsp. villosa TaxID=3103831 RepID=A0AAP0DK00_9ASTR